MAEPDDAALEQALERCRLKKNLARAAQVRRRLDSLRHDALIRPDPSA